MMKVLTKKKKKTNQAIGIFSCTVLNLKDRRKSSDLRWTKFDSLKRFKLFCTDLSFCLSFCRDDVIVNFNVKTMVRILLRVLYVIVIRKHVEWWRDGVIITQRAKKKKKEAINQKLTMTRTIKLKSGVKIEIG